MIRAPLTCALLALMATSAMASEWQKDKLGNYTLVAKQEALMLQCDAVTTGTQTTYEPQLYLYPSCGIACPDTHVDDEKKLASIILDEKSFTADIMATDTDGLLLKPNMPAEFLQTLYTAQHISVYSSQVTPHYTEFKDIENADELDEFAATCKVEGPNVPMDISVSDVPPAN